MASWGIQSFLDFAIEEQLKEHHSSRKIYDDRDGRRPYKISVSPESIDFGSIQLEYTSLAQTIKVSNIGYRPVKILSVKVVGDFYGTFQAPELLLPGESFLISVVFVPKTKGTVYGGVYIDSGDAEGTEFVTLTGTGIYDYLLYNGYALYDGTYFFDGDNLNG